MRSRVNLNHYATREVNGVLWVYLGDQSSVPRFPEFEFNTLKPEQVFPIRAVTHCSWLQTLEAAIDSAHLNFLHNGHVTNMGNDKSVGEWKLMEESAPRFEIEKTKYGFKEAAIRDLIDGSTYLRLRHMALPFFSMVGFAPGAPMLVVASIPINDECNAQWLFTFTTGDSVAELMSSGLSEDSDTVVTSNLNNFAEGLGNADNSWNQDREFMKSHWSGIRGPLPLEDLVVTESMGPIVDRTKENLGSSDIIIIKNRRYVLNMLMQIQSGEEPDIQGYSIEELNDLRGVAIRYADKIDWRDIDGKNPPIMATAE